MNSARDQATLPISVPSMASDFPAGPIVPQIKLAAMTQRIPFSRGCTINRSPPSSRRFVRSGTGAEPANEIRFIGIDYTIPPDILREPLEFSRLRI